MSFINYKKLLILFIPLSFLSYVAIDQYYNLIIRNELKIIENSAVNDLNAKKLLVKDLYRRMSVDIDIVNWQIKKTFTQSTSFDKEELTEFFVHFSTLEKSFDQIRFLDTLGREIVRVDFDSAHLATIISSEKLQDKSSRYYFQSAKKMQEEEIYFSNIDLNIENGELEYPYNPVLRVAQKTYNQSGQWNGVVIMNYFINDLVQKLASHGDLLYTSFELLNQDGFYLISKQEYRNFSHIILGTDSLAIYKDHQNLWEEAQENDEGNCIHDDAVFVFNKLKINDLDINNTNYEGVGELLLINVIHLDELSLSQSVYFSYKWLSFVFLMSLIFFALMAVQYYNYRLKIQNKKLEKANAHLAEFKNRLEATLQRKLGELKLTERKFSSLFENASIGITLVDMEGKPVFSNKKLVNILQYSEEELSTMTFAEFTHPDDVGADLEQFGMLLNREIDSYNMEKRYIRKDGTVIWADLNVSLLVDSEYKIVNVIGAVSDITDKKHAEQKLFENAQIIDQVVEAIVSTSKDDIIVFCNKAAETLFGFSAEEVVGQHIHVLYGVGMTGFKEIEGVNILQNEKSVSIEKELNRKDGQSFFAAITISQKFNNDGELIGHIRTIVDITDRKRYEQRLKTLNRELNENILFLDNIMEYSPFAMWISDAEGTLIRSNQALRNILQLSDEQILGVYKVLSDQNLIDQGVMQQVENVFKEHVVSRFEIQWTESKIGLESLNKRRVYNLDLTMFPIVNENGELQNVVCQWLDITERKKADVQIEQMAQNFKNVFNEMNDSVALVDFNNQIVNVNQSLLDRHGYTFEEIIGKNIATINPYITKEERSIIFKKLKGSSERVGYESRHVTKNGEVFPVEVQKKIINFGSQEMILKISRDITERKAYEKTIKEREAMLFSITSSAQDGIILIDNNGEVIFWNPAATRILGYAESEMKGEVFHHIVPPEKYRAQHFKKFASFKVTGKGEMIGKKVELEAIHKDGRLIPVELSLSATRINEKWGATGIIRDITERKRDQEELIKSRNQISKILEVAPAGIGQIVNRTFTELNHRFCEMLEYSKEELIGENALMIYPTPEEYEHVGNELYNQSADGLARLETRFISKSGKIIDVIIVSTYVDRNDPAKGSIFTALDFTEQKAAQKELLKYQHHLEDLVQERTEALNKTNVQLRENQYRLDAAFISSGYAWWDIRPAKGQLFAHHSMYTALGYQPDEQEISLEWWWKHVESTDRRVIIEVRKELIQGAKSFDREIRLKHKNGSYHWFNIRGSVIEHDKHGKPSRFIGTSEDISSEKKTKVELLKLSKAVQQSPVVVVITNTRAQIEYANPSFEQLTGYSLHEIKGRNPKFLNARMLPASVYQDLWHTILSGKTWEGELCNRTKSGEIFWENAVISPVIDENGKTINYIAVKENITERKQFIEELKNAKKDAEAGNRSKSEFLANMSHEIRTPMNAVIGFTDILSRKITNPTHQQYLSSIKTSSKNLLTIINDILDISKIEAGKIEIKKEEFNIVSLLEELEAIFRIQAENKGLELDISFQKLAYPIIYSDEMRIRQILYNLLSNAMKFTTKGFVKVSLHMEEVKHDDEKGRCGELKFVVEDSGIGIREEAQDKVFESFVQQEGQDYKKFGGTGLGLTISKNLAHLLGGDIYLESEENKGAKFILTLKDVECVKGGENTPQKRIHQTVVFNSKHVLVVDDIASNRDFLQNVLHDLGLIVHTATDGVHGFNILEKRKIDLIVTDIRMPRMDGYEFIEKLRAGKYKKIPCVAVTASALEDEIAQIKSCDFDDLLLKPINFEELLHVLKNHVPYRVVDNQDEKKPETSKPVLTKDESQRITHVIEETIRPLHQSLKEQQSFDDMKKFSEVIYSTGIKYNIDVFCSFSAEFTSAIESFDIEKIVKLIAQFDEII